MSGKQSARQLSIVRCRPTFGGAVFSTRRKHPIRLRLHADGVGGTLQNTGLKVQNRSLVDDGHVGTVCRFTHARQRVVKRDHRRAARGVRQASI